MFPIDHIWDMTPIRSRGAEILSFHPKIRKQSPGIGTGIISIILYYVTVWLSPIWLSPVFVILSYYHYNQMFKFVTDGKVPEKFK